MKIIKPENAELRPNPFNAIVKNLFINEKSDVLLLELNPFKKLAPVKVDFNSFFYVLEGSPEIIIDSDSQIVDAEALIFCPVSSIHCINNPGESTARILIIKQKD